MFSCCYLDLNCQSLEWQTNVHHTGLLVHWLTEGVKILIIHICTAGLSVSFESRSPLLTGQNDLAVFDHSTRRTYIDTCNVKHVGKPE